MSRQQRRAFWGVLAAFSGESGQACAATRQQAPAATKSENRHQISGHTEGDLKGRLSNPLEIAETLVARGSERIGGPGKGLETARIRPSDDHAEGPREEEGRLSNPAQRRLSPTDINDLIAAYEAGATITQLAAKFGIHRTTVANHLDGHGVPRHNEQTAWGDEILTQAAEFYAAGSSLADVAHRFGVDAQTVANRFRRAGVAVRPRRGWTSPARSEREQH